MRLVAKQIGKAWEWVVEASDRERDGLPAGDRNEDSRRGTQLEGIADNAQNKKGGASSAKIAVLCAMADPAEKWWERVRRNPKRSGEISQAAFLLKAEMMGFKLAVPWGDSERWDFVVWGRDEKRVVRVQVKGTGRLYLGGYEVQPVHSTRRGRKKRYTKKEIDVIAAHVQPVDTWYLIPIEAVGRARSLRLYPEASSVQQDHGGADRRSRRMKQPGEWEQWLGAWEVLGEAR